MNISFTLFFIHKCNVLSCGVYKMRYYRKKQNTQRNVKYSVLLYIKFTLNFHFFLFVFFAKSTYK